MYGVITTVPAPVEMYDTVHAEILRRVSFIDGLLVHIRRARPTASRCWRSGSQKSTTTAPILTSSFP